MTAMTPVRTLSLLSAAAEPGLPVPSVAIIVPLAAFATIFAVVALITYARFRRDQERHQTLRAMIERGAAIPPELIAVPRGSDLGRGIVLLGAGAGLSVALFTFNPAHDLWGLGAVPGLIGVGYLIAWWLERRGADGAARTPRDS